MTRFAFAFLAFSSLFSVINPISCAPLFVTMTEKQAHSRKSVAVRASLAAGITLALFAVAGGAIFAFFGITVPAFQIAGGILFTIMAIRSMETGEEYVSEEDKNGSDPSIVPLGIPLIAGPGAISTVMVLIGQARDGLSRVAVGTAILINIALTLLVFLAAPAIVRRIGETGQKIVAKVMGLITAVIGIQFIINGVTTVAHQILKAAQ